MNPKNLAAMMVIGACAWSAGAVAGGAHRHSVEVETPLSVSESAPSLTGQPLRSSTPEAATVSGRQGRGDGPPNVGTASSASGSGSIGFDSTTRSTGSTDYWHMGEEPSGTGSSSSRGASVSVDFSSSSSSDASEVE